MGLFKSRKPCLSSNLIQIAIRDGIAFGQNFRTFFIRRTESFDHIFEVFQFLVEVGDESVFVAAF